MHSKIINHLGLIPLVLSVAFAANAHNLRISVYVEENDLEGELYFVGGGNPAAKNASVELIFEDTVIANTTSDQEGLFVFQSVDVNNYKVRADAGQGHVAIYELTASEFPLMNSSDTKPKSTATDIKKSTCVNEADHRELQVAITQAVRPLREQLERYESKTRLHDILGGTGYVFGLFGLFVLYRQRKATCIKH